VVHQQGKKDMEGRKVMKDKRRDSLMMVRSKYPSGISRGEEKP
jgi:hypothetical protein